MDHKKMLAQSFAVFAIVFLFAGNIYAATITSIPGSSSSAYFIPFGSPDTQSYGQTFVAPSGDTVLNNFSLYVGDMYDYSGYGTGTLHFYGYIAEWSIATPGTIGAVLYKSNLQSVYANGLLQKYIFDTGSLNLAGGGIYLAYLSIAELPSQGENKFAVPLVSDRITGGFTYKNSYDQTWWLMHQGSLNGGSSDGDDVWFEANFSAPGAGATPVPEPGTMVLLGSGLMGLVGYGRKRLKK